MNVRSALVATSCLAWIGAAPARADASPEPAAPTAVLRAPLPPGKGPCATSRVDAGHVRASLAAPDAMACAVARVGDEIVPLGELAETLASSHEAGPRGAAGGLSGNLDRALGRIIDLRLLVQEARDMGMGELPELVKALDGFAEMDLRARLERDATARVRPDDAEVQALYQDAVREWSLRSLLFPRSEDAAAFRARVAQGEAFEGAGRLAVAAKTAQGSPEAAWVKASAVVPQVRAALAALGAGEVVATPARGTVTQVVEVKDGFVVAQVDGVRYPDDAQALADARAASLDRRRQAALLAYHESLAKKHATVDPALLDRLDFEAEKPGFRALRADRRVLARIRGAAPVRVSDLAAALQKKFFHGIDRPVEEKRVNAQKAAVFRELLRGRVLAREAAVRRLADAPEHRAAVEEHRRGLLFSAMLEKVIVPDVKVGEDEARRWYEEHRADFTQPQMYRLEGLGFAAANRAQAALEKLRGGSDLAWMRANADGQLRPEEARLLLDGRTASAAALPAGLAKALAGAKRGDHRLYAEGGQHYVVRVADEFPPAVQPYAQAREAVAKRLFAERVGAAVHDYAEQLRKVRKVEIFLARLEN